jgi:hypothetical protein
VGGIGKSNVRKHRQDLLTSDDAPFGDARNTASGRFNAVADPLHKLNEESTQH